MLSIGIECLNLGGMTTTLKALLAQRIEDAYDGNQAAFARATGFRPQTVHTWLKGSVTLPNIDARRRLAKEFGMSHLELLVAVGELDASEASVPDDPRSDMVRHLQPLIDAVEWDRVKVETIEGLLKVFAGQSEP